MTRLAPWPSDFEERLGVSRESAEKLATFVKLLRQWQARINLISPATLDDIWERHIADCLQLVRFLPQQARTLADLGSGAGLPGLVLGCARPLTLHLYEANSKKAAFLREAARQTGSEAHVHAVRLETLAGRTDLPTVDAVTARALAPLDRLLDLAFPFLQRGAPAIFPKGESVDSELTEAGKSWTIRFSKHASLTDSKSAILVIHEVARVVT